VLVWGGFGETTLAGQSLNVPEKGGASYNPVTRTWAKLPNGPLSDRRDPSAVWTGNQMIVFGGQNTADKTLLSGATYTPATKTWARMPVFPGTRLGGVPVATTSVWNGKQFVVWATFEERRYIGNNTTEISPRKVMAEWTPGTSHWRELAEPLRIATVGATSMWTGTRVVLVNGTDCLPGESCAPSFDYTPESSFLPRSGKWGELPQSIVLAGNGPTLWTGQAILTLNLGAEIGGSKQNLSPGQGAAFDPARKRWISLPSAPIVGLLAPTYIWTGNSFVVWGQGSHSNQGEALIPSGPIKQKQLLKH
jgi:N-acetylneuraminic acid mutarotase